MSFQVIRQPGGKLAIFSSENDCWVQWNLKPRQAARWFARRAYREVLESALRKASLVAAGEASKAYGRNLAMDFAQANARSTYHGGPVLDGPVDEGFLEFLESGLDDDDAPES